MFPFKVIEPEVTEEALFVLTDGAQALVVNPDDMDP
jgi:hypothetical protein